MHYMYTNNNTRGFCESMDGDVIRTAGKIRLIELRRSFAKALVRHNGPKNAVPSRLVASCVAQLAASPCESSLICDVRTHQNEDSTLKHNYCNVMNSPEPKGVTSSLPTTFPSSFRNLCGSNFSGSFQLLESFKTLCRFGRTTAPLGIV